ncbi:hypothetical protein CHLNCDRAFT_55443 [Chlorella variabilis]|uniref:F-box domain-containing protein n=1 Tax=Chlorella variabilis TaxID=554065 RepID=E1ZT81_CHLVA|nr:hypothetical protein CHLNCDRAFT_55443 [Chlorella variabilis]EFN50986.1 hypothetical protein CHLNCDRAFT_55443 [Chlorella variabilis]|eukprot:XP_005843088.1 hypothetical protein CHLNCDRAFT_55443 [Chlorella variabilis]
MDEAASCSRQRGPGLLSLPSSVLEAIFALVDLRQRAGVLPLVCAAVRRQLAGPSASLWHDLRFECDIAHASQRTRATSFLAWLRRHGQHSRALQLDMWNGGQPPPAEQEGVHRALREVLEATLAASLPSCEFLRLRWGGRVLVVGDWAAAATSLTCLALSGHEVCVGSPLGALSSLVHLELSTTEDIGPSLEPGCLPASLTRLCCVPAPASAPPPLGDDDWPGLAEAQIPEEALALPHLVYLDVSGGIPAQLSLLTRLRVLSFDGCPAQEVEDALQPSWTVLSALTRIASLSISNSRLESVPPALAAMPSLQGCPSAGATATRRPSNARRPVRRARTRQWGAAPASTSAAPISSS